MASRFTHWLTNARRWFGTPKTVRHTANRSARPRVESLDARIAPATFTGGVTTVSGDINGDGFTDIVTGAGPGGSPQVKVFSGRNGALIRQFNAFDANFQGGVFVALGDVNADGRQDIICGAGRGGTPHVKVYDGLSGATLNDFLAYGKRFIGGVRVAAADLTGDGRAEILTAPGAGGSPHIQAFDPTTSKAVLSFAAFDGKFTQGVYIATGDVTGDSRPDIIIGAGEGAPPIVNVFNPFDSSKINRSFFAFDVNFRGGVRVGTADVATTQPIDIVTGAGPGGGPHVKVFSGATGEVVREFFAFDPGFRGGVNVGQNTDFNGVGAQEILVGAATGGGPHVVGIDGDNGARLVSFYAYEVDGVPNGNPGAFAQGRDTVAPTLTITSPLNSPRQRTNLTITGNAADNRSGVNQVQVAVDSGAFQNVAFNATTGAFTFTSSFPLTGGADGLHSFRFRATDRSGNVSPDRTVTFTLDSAVSVPVMNLADASDSGTKGDLITSITPVTITGKTDAGASVELVGLGQSTTADGTGNFQFSNVTLVSGSNSFTVRATDDLGNTSTGMVTITLNSAPIVQNQQPDITVPVDAPNTVIDLSTKFSDVDIVNSLVRFSTSEGTIDVQLFDAQTPLTVANFLNYLNRGDYNSSIFHRLVNNFVIQGGGFQFQSSPVPSLPPIETDPPVLNEPGISNTRGRISMAKLGSDPNSATSQFFFNLGDNSGNLDNQNGGFTAFGEIVSGLNVMDALAANYTPTDQGGVFNEIPLRNYNGSNFPTDTTFSNYAGINNVALIRRSDRLTFSVTANDNPDLVTATIAGKNLTLDYAAGQTGEATITIRATDLDGSFVEMTFKVTVG